MLAIWLVAAVPSAHAEHSVIEHATSGTGANAGAGFGGVFPIPDGSRVFFITTEALTPDDTDPYIDAYEYAVGAGTNLVTTGPTAGNQSVIAEVQSNPDGSRVFVRTDERLTADDTDTRTDIYLRAGGTTTLVSTSSENTLACHGDGDAFLGAPWQKTISADGTRLLFYTNERLLTEDDDCGNDVYEWANGALTLVSKGTQTQAAGSTVGATLIGASTDLSTVYFYTRAALEPEDTDASQDLYARAGAATTLISTGPDGGNGEFDAQPAPFGGPSGDGQRMYFQTDESLVTVDADAARDVYLRSGSTTSLVSAGPAGGNGGQVASFGQATPDGQHAVFSTPEPLVSADMDARFDVYRYSAGGIELMSTGPVGGNGAFDALPSTPAAISADGSHVFFQTLEQLVTADIDGFADSYERFGGTTSLVSPGTGHAVSALAGITPDASRKFFSTTEPLVTADKDTFHDLYERVGNVVTLVTPGARANAGGQPALCCNMNSISADAGRVFFQSQESYATSDTDTVPDLYVASIAQGPIGYARPRGATPLRVPLVPAYHQCTSPHREHGPPLAFGSCNPPAQTSGNLTVGTPDSNGQPANSVGSVRFSVTAGDPGTTSDEADVVVAFSLTDVRVRSTLADYTGQLRSTVTARVTEKPESSGADITTLQDLDFPATVPCSATAGTAGATCAVTTSFDAVIPGAIIESRRTIWQLDRVRVYDGGPDGFVFSEPNDLFATQGVFVP